MSEPRGSGQVRCHVIFTGRVQGVFFRATSAELASGYPIVGYVRNLRDGSVELEAQGPAADVEAFIAAIEKHFAGYIRTAQRTEMALRGDEAAFEIRY